MASRATAILNLMNHSRFGALAQLLVIDAVMKSFPNEKHRDGETNVDLVKRLMAANRGVVETVIETRAQEITGAGKEAVIEACKRSAVNGAAWYGVASEMEDACGEAIADRFLIVERYGFPDQQVIEAYSDDREAAVILKADYSDAKQQELNVRLVCEDGDGNWHLDF
ncbi:MULTISPECIES: hypothetical protein [Brevundimonas]|uniref:Uncharacterized protein n=1 Tax=Brevundimonas nasdae TaxID=172043 RepID=A0A0B4CN89_9CAUL|nr:MULTISPECIES: hypothetical protein [Brevundimonas]KIC55896.1 hypothetical protein RM53_14365 [Brevundimonas nasdae]RSB43084.1 hypothetical protein EGK63_12810 [Brevundimonas sp. 357]